MVNLNYGIIGAGRISEKFARTFSQGLVNNAKLIAVAARSKERAEKFAQKFGIEKSYGSYSDILADDSIDIVYIATTNNAHFENCKEAINAGKHVLCEKPLVMTKAHAQELARLAQDKNVFIMEAMWTRFLPTVQKALEWVKEGKIGRLKNISTSFSIYREEEVNSRLFEKELGGGALCDLGVYNLSFSQFFAEGRKIEKLNSMVVKSSSGIDKETHLVISYDDGVTADMMCGFNFKGCNTGFVYGEEGFIKFSYTFNFPKKIELYKAPFQQENEGAYNAPVEVFTHDSPSGFEFQAMHAVDCINSGLIVSPILPMVDVIEISGIYDEVLKDLR